MGVFDKHEKTILAAVEANRVSIGQIQDMLKEIQKQMAVNQATLDADLATLQTAVNTEATTIQNAAADITGAFSTLLAKIAAGPTPIDFTAEDSIVQAATAAIQQGAANLAALDITAKADNPPAPPATT
jgi:hypothetical protein